MDNWTSCRKTPIYITLYLKSIIKTLFTLNVLIYWQYACYSYTDSPSFITWAGKIRRLQVTLLATISGVQGCSHIITWYTALPETSKWDSRSSDVGCEYVNVGLHDQLFRRLSTSCCFTACEVSLPVTRSQWVPSFTGIMVYYAAVGCTNSSSGKNGVLCVGWHKFPMNNKELQPNNCIK